MSVLCKLHIKLNPKLFTIKMLNIEKYLESLIESKKL